MELLNKTWLRRLVSVVCGIYGVFLIWLTYTSAFYDIVYVKKPLFAFVYVAATLAFFAIMFFARKQVFTSILAMIMMFLLVPFVIFNLGDWLIIIPPVVLSITLFFICGANETVKTIFGTIFLLLYILSAVAYFLFINFFITKSVDTPIGEKVPSPTGIYRYYVYDVKDNSSGKTEIYVEPNDRDKDFGMVKFEARGFEKCVYRERDHNVPKVEWRQEDGKDVLFVNDKRFDFEIGKREFSLN